MAKKSEAVTPEVTEKAQIVVSYENSTPGLILRFSTVKKGEKEFAALCAAWKEYKAKRAPMTYMCKADMFDAMVGMDGVSNISFIDIAKRNRFIPYQPG